MEVPHIILVDDQREVLTTLVKDLKAFESAFQIDECESADEALDLVEEIDEDGEEVCLILSDQVMPDKSGVELLTELHEDDRFRNVKKILVTGQATHDDTINAINNASINYYIKKPWSSKQLINTVKKLLTVYALNKGVDVLKQTELYDMDVILEHQRDQ